MRGNYRPNLQYLVETAGKTIDVVYEKTLDALRWIYTSKAARRGLLIGIYLAGSANLLADNASHENKQDAKPNAPSKQKSDNSSKRKEKKSKTSADKEKGEGGLAGIVDGIWQFPGNVGKWLDAYFAECKDYGVVDNYLYRELPEGATRGERISDGAYHFPGHFVISVKDFAYGATFGVTKEAIERADAEKKEEQAKNPPKEQKERNREGLAILLVPADIVWDAGAAILETGADTFRVGKHLPGVIAEGSGRILVGALQNPAETVSMTAASYGTGAAIKGIFGTGSGDGKGGAEFSGPDKPDFTGK